MAVDPTPLQKPRVCHWCGATTTDLLPFRVSYRFRKGLVDYGVWWLSPCCLIDVDSDRWVVASVGTEPPHQETEDGR